MDSMREDWRSVEDIKSEFGIPDSVSDVVEVRRHLRLRMKEVHPDSTEGKFRSYAQEADFHRLESAIAYIDRHLVPTLPESQRNALLVASEFSEAVAGTLREARARDHEMERSRQLEDAQKRASEHIDAEVKRKYVFLKAVAGVLALVFAILTLFPEKFSGHPVFRAADEFTEALDVTLGVVFIYLLIASGAAIVYLAWEEQRERKRKKECLSDRGTDKLLRSKHFVARLSPTGQFTRSDLIEALDKNRISNDQNVLNDVAGLIIAKLIARGAARKIDKPSINEIYELEIGVHYDIKPQKK